MIGTAKIISNDTGGKYTITQVYYDTVGGSYELGTVGLVNADAVDVNLRSDREVDDIVCFQEQATYDGLVRPVITGFSGTLPALGVAFVRNYLFEVKDNHALSVVDSVSNYGTSFITGTAVYDAGAIVLGDGVDDNVSWWNSAQAAWTAQATGKTLHTYVPDAGQDLMKIDGYSQGDFLLLIGGDGLLYAQATNFAGDFFVIVSLWCSGSVVEADKITLG